MPMETASKVNTKMGTGMERALFTTRMETDSKVNILMGKLKKERNFSKVETMRSAPTKMGRLADLVKNSSKMETGLKGNTRTVTGTERALSFSRMVTNSKEVTKMARHTDLESNISRTETDLRENMWMEKLKKERNITQMETLKNVLTKMAKLMDSGRKYFRMATGLRGNTRTEIGMEKGQNISRMFF